MVRDMSKEFDAIEFLMELDRMAEGCETEEEIHKLYDEEMEKLTDEQKLELSRVIKETEELSMAEESTKFIPVETEHLEGIGIDTKKFDKGVDDVSRICGQFSALKSVGMSDKDAMEVITNLITIQINNDTIEGNIRVANLQDTLSRI